MPPRSRAKKATEPAPAAVAEPEHDPEPQVQPEQPAAPEAPKKATRKRKNVEEPAPALQQSAEDRIKEAKGSKQRGTKAQSSKTDKPDDVDAPHVILQLPISNERVKEIVSKLEGAGDNRMDPCPYVPNHYWTMSCSSYSTPDQNLTGLSEPTLCHWCCHAITSNKVGMPIDYDSIHNVFHVYGQFCSLSCAAAYNVSTHMGSDRMWDIHSWIQMMAQVYQQQLPVRPAPSRYVLKMFGGPLSIDEFRSAHTTLARTVVLNVPPLVSVQPQVEWVNTSFLAGSGNGLAEGPSEDGENRTRLTRRKSVVDSKRTLESKMNLTVVSIDE